MKLQTLKWIPVVAFALVAFFTTPLFANTIGFTYSQALDDTAWGVTADYETEVRENVDFGLEGQLQAGDSYAGNLNLSLTLWNIRLESNNILTGYELTSLGRDNDLGASYVFGIGDLEISAGLFGKSGNPFSPVYELKDPTDPTSAELKDAGILIKEGSSLNLALRTEFDLARFEIGLRGLLEVAGEEGSEKAHQLRADVQTGGELIGSINWVAQAQIVAQMWGREITYQTTGNLGVNYPF